MLHNESRRLYSWWWDSHNSPKNSKWLQENLTDMDVKVKSMIKLIEEDADSFARRAEMYYKKRPELMKLVEEFYRAYRALAERYDHATVELRHAHRTMAQAFPDQAPFSNGEESQSCSSSGPEAEIHTPDGSRPIRAPVDPDELHRDVMGVSSAKLKRGLKQLTEMLDSEGCGQNFEDGDSEVSSRDQSAKAESEVQILKKTLAKVQAEKDTLLYQFQQNVEKLKNAERDLSDAQRDVGRLGERASEAEIEIKTLKEALSESEAERDAGLVRIEKCLEKISGVETCLSQSREEGEGQRERAVKAETELKNLEGELSRLEAEKEAALARYKRCLERISDLESRIALAEESSRSLGTQLKRSESEVEALKKALGKMAEEKETASMQYKQCTEIILMMEEEISRAQTNTERLNGEILAGAEKLKSAEEQCASLKGSNQTLQSEADDLLRKISMKDQELLEKNDELNKFQSMVVEESSKFQQVAATLQALQRLHSKSREEQRAMASELKDGLQMLKDAEICKNGMEEELQRVKDENKSLSELGFSSSEALKSLQDEILGLKEMKEKLELEVSHKEDQSDALQGEIGNLKEEINGLKQSYYLIIKRVDATGLNPECLESAVKDLRDENSELKEVCKRDSKEKEILNKKLKEMTELSTENTVLQNSMSGLSVELEDLREKVEKLRESCHFLEGEKSDLVAEKATLLLQLQMITENMQKLVEKNTSLESSLGSANSELEQLRLRSKSLEEMCQTLGDEKSNLVDERNSLVRQLENVEKRLGKLETRFEKLEEKYLDLEMEKESTVDQIEALRGSILVEKQERSSYIQSTEAHLSGLQSDVHVLQEETRLGKKEFEEELDRAVNSHIEIFILQKFVEDLEEKNSSLLAERQKHIDTQKFSDDLISELESENLEQQVEAEFLVNEIEKLRLGIRLVFRALQVNSDSGNEKKLEPEQVSVRSILENVEDLKFSLSRSEDEERKLMVENSVLISLLESEKENSKREFEVIEGQHVVLRKEKQDLLDSNTHLRLELSERDHREEVLKTTLEAVHEKMEILHGSYVSLKEHNIKVIEDNRSLLKKLLDLGEENEAIIEEAVSLSTLSLVLEAFAAEKADEGISLSEDLNRFSEANEDLKAETRILREKLGGKEMENLLLKDSVEALGNKVHEVHEINDQMSLQVFLEKEFLREKSTELTEADEKIKVTERLNGKLCATVEDLKVECEELKWNRENLDRKILELTEERSNQRKEVEILNEIRNGLETKVGMLSKEIEEHRIREENLSTELEEKSNKFELWEAEASGFYFDLQISAVREVLLENKVHELMEVCKSLEGQSSVKTMEIEQIQNKVKFLESHVRKLETKLSAYVPVVASLKENVASLEHNARLKTKLLEASNNHVHRRETSGEQFRDFPTPELPDGIEELQRMQSSIKAVEKAMVEEIEKLEAETETAKNEKAMEEEVERLAEQETADTVPLLVLEERNDDKILNLMKDIQLDRGSNRSRSHSRSGSRRKTGGPGDQLWETTISPASSELSRRPSQKSFRNSSSSELSVTDNKPKRKQHKGAVILERLASDANKLANLQRSVEDLKKKIEACNGGGNNDDDDYEKRRGKKKTSSRYGHVHVSAAEEELETVQRHLLEVEEAVVELAGLNGQLSEESREGKSVTEQARKGAEKIGQLQFEVQNIQYILLKLGGGDEGSEKKGKAGRFAGVLLRDFIYSSRRKRQVRRRSGICCSTPRTRED